MYMKQLRYFLPILLVSITISAFAGSTKQLYLKSGNFYLTEISANAELAQAISQNSLNGYSIIQFSQVPTEAEKQVLTSNGISLLEYLPEYSFLAFSNNPSSINVGELNIVAINSYLPQLKLMPEVASEIIPSWAIFEGDLIELSIDKQLNVNSNEILNDLQAAGAVIVSQSSNEEYFIIRIEQYKIASLAELASVKFIDFIPAPPEPEDTRARSLHRGNLLDTDHPLGPKYDGSGVGVAIADDGDIGPHIDLKGRYTSFAPASRGTHGDMTTGITMGAGNVDPRYRGMATDAYLWYYDISGYPHISQAVNNLNNRGVVVTSTSYSEGCNAGYTATTREVDQQTRQNPELLHVFSAGNSAASTCGGNAYGAGTPWGTITGGRKQGKSAIATGNLEYRGFLTASSSRGPSADGRIKPDICANGTNQISTDPNNTYAPGGGTSAAAPGIAGLAVQMYDGYRQLNGGADPESALIKSAMLNTARDIGNPGPDFFYGWGRVNAGRAMKLIEENRYVRSTITQTVSNSHTIALTNPLEELNIMTYWADYEASTVASLALVNNLDMIVINPNGDTLRPWVLNSSPNATSLSQNAVPGIDNRNNMEQVTIDNAAAGTYTVIIGGKVVPQGPQPYYMLWETRDNSIQVTYPSGGEPFVPSESEIIRWDAVGNSGTFNVDYSLDSGATWNPIATNLAGSTRYRNWAVPNAITGDALVRVTRGNITGVSENTFTVAPLPSVSVQYVCPDSIGLRWNLIPNITDYEVLALGATHMDSVASSDTTVATIYNLNLSDDNWVAVKALNLSQNITGRRTTAFNLPKAALNCPLPYDFGITSINSPGVGTVTSCGGSKLPVQVTINNNGDSLLTNVPIKMVFGNTTFLDTVSGPVAPKTFQFFTFKDSLTLTPGSYLLSAVGLLTNDQNEINDSVAVNVNIVGGQQFTIPYSNDFENFTSCATTSNCGGTFCNLSGGWINMINGSDDIFDMRVNSGGTPSNGTGPTIDHNPGTATGKYIYSEASNGCTGVESRVLSPCFDLTGATSPELSFWYHMEGTDMGVLRLDVLADGGEVNNIMTPLFGSNGSVWLEQKVDLSNFVGQKITLRFRVTTGGGWSSDLALDDVSIADLSTGLGENKNDIFSLYPNPSDGIFNIKFTETKTRRINVIDLQGRIVYSEFNSNQNTRLDLSNLSKGIYFIDIEGINRREKIIIN